MRKKPVASIVGCELSEQNGARARVDRGFETLLLTLANKFINLPAEQVDGGIQDALAKIGEYCAVDRSWIIEFNTSDNSASNTFEWCAPGIRSTIHAIQDFPTSEAPWFMRELSERGIVLIGSLADIPPEAEVERQLIESQDIKSLVCVPLMYVGTLLGIVGFDSVAAEKVWEQEQINLLSIVGEMLVNAIHRKRVDIAQKDHELRFRAVIEGLAEGLLIGDNNDVVFYCNKRLADMTGYAQEELTGVQAYKILCPPEEWYKVEGGTERRFKGAVDRYELLLRRKDGTTFMTEISATPYLNTKGEIVGTIAAIFDMTEQLHAEQEKAKLQRQLLQAQKMEAVGQLAAGIAHDLNNALGAIVGHLQLIKMTDSLPPSTLQSVEQAFSGCNRASSLINQLLSFSRQGRYDFKVLAAQEIVEDTLAFLGRVVHKSIELKRSGQLEPLFVSVDPAQIQQVLTNLIINASHAMPNGGTLHFSFSTTYMGRPQSFNPKAKAGNFVVLTVSDTGEGISPEHISKIFDPFFTTKEEGLGSGLGLSMVYAIMQNHGGWISVDSEPGMGTAMTLYLPQVGAPALSLVEGAKERHSAEENPAGATVLVIDDEPMLVDLACSFLGRAGIQTQAFSKPEEAFAWYRAHFKEVGLVLLDMKMPGYNGTKSFKVLREINPGVQVVLISGYIDDADVHSLLDAGALSFIQKPVKYAELVSWVTKILAEKRPPQKLALVH